MAKVKNNYKVVLEVLGEKWRGQGSTVLKALEKVPVRWEQIVGKGTITVKKGLKSFEYMTNGFKLRKIFSNKIIRQATAKNLENLLKAGKKTNVPR